MEGNLPCLKFLVSEAQNPSHILGARNDNGETPKMLAQHFYKDTIVEYISNIEWEREHPEEAESKLLYHTNLNTPKSVRVCRFTILISVRHHKEPA